MVSFIIMVELLSMMIVSIFFGKFIMVIVMVLIRLLRMWFFFDIFIFILLVFRIIMCKFILISNN